MTDRQPATNELSPLIEELAAAVVLTARPVRGRWLFVGWSADGRPVATTDPGQLGEQARRAAEQYQGAGLTPRRIPYSRLTPVEYVLTGPAIDYADVGERRAEDQLRYTVVDAQGERREVILGEMAVLGAIADARQPWQLATPAGALDVAVSAVPLYTLFAPLPGQRADQGVAMLFRPTIPGRGNTAAFQSFVRQTLSRLLILDESQPARRRKGYLEAAGRIAGPPPRGGLAALLLWLRRLGVVEFSDEWYRGLAGRGRRARVALARLLKAIGVVELSDEALGELGDLRPDYDIDPLDLERLIDLAAAMYQVARRTLRPQ